MCEQAVVRTPAVQNISLMPSGMTCERAGLALGERASAACAMSRARSGVSSTIGVERARLLDRGEMRVGKFGRGEFLLPQRHRAPAPE